MIFFLTRETYDYNIYQVITKECYRYFIGMSKHTRHTAKKFVHLILVTLIFLSIYHEFLKIRNPFFIRDEKPFSFLVEKLNAQLSAKRLYSLEAN